MSAPALFIIFAAAAGPLLIVLAYSFMKAAPYGDVLPELSLDGWIGVFMQRDIFDDTLGIADAHVSIFLRSVKLSLITTLLTLIARLPDRLFHCHAAGKNPRPLAGFLITIPFWTNLLIRTFAILVIVRNEGADQHAADQGRHDRCQADCRSCSPIPPFSSA